MGGGTRKDAHSGRKGREKNAVQKRGDKKQKQVPSPHHNDIRTDKDKKPS